LAAVLRGLNDAIVIHDFEGRISFWNHTAERIYGYPEAEALNMNVEQLIPKDLRAETRAHWDRLRRGLNVDSWETRRIRKDGREIDIWATVTTVQNDVGQPVAVAKIDRDITDRKQAAEALSRSEERLRLALSAGQMGTWDWDLSTDALTWDDRQFELFGIPRESFRKVAAQALATIHLEDQPRIDAAIHSARNQGVTFREEFRVIHADGSVRWLIGLGQPLSDGAGTVTRMIGVNFDVTERKQAEDALKKLTQSLERQIADRTQSLRAREELLQSILNTAADAIITIDHHGIIRSVNPAAEQMFGYSAAEMIGHSVNMLMPSPFREEHDGYLTKYLKTGETHIIGINREVVARRKDGSVFPADLAVSEIEHLKLFTGIHRDLTQRKQLEREVVEAASAEQRRIGQDLHDTVAQELTALNMLVKDLAEIVQTDPAKAASLVEQMALGLQRSQQELRAVLRGLLPVAVDGEGLMAALTELAEHTQQEGKVNCRFECRAPVTVTDNLTATHLYLIAHEAVHNAVKHAKAEEIHIKLTKDGGLVLRVQDDGVGIPAQTTSNHGLGLRIMRNRASILGAKLTIEAAHPSGTILTCGLPRTNNASQ
jgi:PAS domain S-box-containing protein